MEAQSNTDMKIIIFLFIAIVFGLVTWAKNVSANKNKLTEGAIPDSLYPAPGMVISYHTKWAKNNYKKRIREFKEHPLAMHDIVFIGNSIIEQGGDWGWRFGSPIIKNRGISGDVTEGVFKRLGEIIYIQPKAIFLLCGINDLLADKKPEFVVSNTLKIVAAIHQQSPDTKVFVQTILPTSNPFLMHKISAVNRQLQSHAATASFTLIDLHTIFANANDLIKPEYTYDGTHPTEEGYQVWVKEEKQLMEKLLNK